MEMDKLCTPAIIYIFFSITQIILDTVNGLFNTALMKIFVMIMITILLQILCQRGLSVISWIIVFIPFILMTAITSILLYTFGLNATTGTMNYSCQEQGNILKNCGNNIYIDASGDILIYAPEYNSNTNPVYFKSPYIVVPNPESYSTIYTNKPITPNWRSSSPAYQS